MFAFLALMCHVAPQVSNWIHVWVVYGPVKNLILSCFAEDIQKAHMNAIMQGCYALPCT